MALWESSQRESVVSAEPEREEKVSVTEPHLFPLRIFLSLGFTCLGLASFFCFLLCRCISCSMKQLLLFGVC